MATKKTILDAYTISGGILTFDIQRMKGPLLLPCTISGTRVTVKTHPLPDGLEVTL